MISIPTPWLLANGTKADAWLPASSCADISDVAVGSIPAIAAAGHGVGAASTGGAWIVLTPGQHLRLPGHRHIWGVASTLVLP